MSLSKLFKIITIILTVLIVGVAIYIFLIIPRIKNNGEVNVTPVVTKQPSITPTTDNSVALCGESCSNSPCEKGTVCTVVKGFRRCAAESCIDSNNKPIQNAGCNSDFCVGEEKSPTPSATPVTVPIANGDDNDSTIITTTPSLTPTTRLLRPSNTITPTPIVITNKPFFVDKIASGTKCVSGSEEKTSTITIAVENLGNSERTVSIKDILQDTYPVSTVSSINLEGTIKDNYVIWENIKLPSKQTITLQYVINTDIQQKTTYTNTIEITEEGYVIQTDEKIISIEILPCTDLTGDQMALLILGISILFIGIVSFRFNTHKFLGTLFLNKVVGVVSKRDFEDRFID